MEEKAAQIEQVAQEIEKERRRRRESAGRKPQRPSKYRYVGLEERTTMIMPEGVDAAGCDVIGKDITCILHRESAKVWVEEIERPILRLKSDKNNPEPHIYQAKAPAAVIGGNHVWTDMLTQIVIDKYRYHLPEYRQVKQYADLRVTLPTSTINDWVHAVTAKLEPLYEAQRCDILAGDYFQIDEVPWRITDTPEKSRKGYAWQFLDNRPDSHGLYILYMNGSRAGTVPRAEQRHFHGAIQSDGYGVYDYFELQDNVTLLDCMAYGRRYVLDGRYHIDNNPVERSQRPSVMGRKNYLFSKSNSGAVDNAIFYTLIESCDITGVNPSEWLTYVLTNLHDDTPLEQTQIMLPYNYKNLANNSREIFCGCQADLFRMVTIFRMLCF